MEKFAAEKKLFHEINAAAQPGGIVLVGSGTVAHLPLTELAQDCMMETPVYNRSIDGLTVEAAGKMLDECVMELKPAKVIFALGAEEAQREDFNLKEFMDQYEWLLYTVNSQMRCRIYVSSVLSDAPVAREMNAALKKLAQNTGCQFVDMAAGKGCDRRHSGQRTEPEQNGPRQWQRVLYHPHGGLCDRLGNDD